MLAVTFWQARMPLTTCCWVRSRYIALTLLLRVSACLSTRMTPFRKTAGSAGGSYSMICEMRSERATRCGCGGT